MAPPEQITALAPQELLKDAALAGRGSSTRRGPPSR